MGNSTPENLDDYRKKVIGIADMVRLEMDNALQVLQQAVPQPVAIKHGSGDVFRFHEKSVQQAIVLKLARMISNFGAAAILLQNGYTMEQGGVQRWLDEAHAEILFLFGGVRFGLTDLHNEFLNAFWLEEFDAPGDPLNSSQKRPVVRNAKIQAYNAQLFHSHDPSTLIAVNNTTYKAYSGYVHGAAPHIFDIYEGHSNRFFTWGVLGTPRMEGPISDFLGYAYRSVCAANFAAMALEQQDMVQRLFEIAKWVERQLFQDD